MIRKHIKISVDIPTTDADNKLLLEPGRGGVVVFSNGQFKVGVDIATLREALIDLEIMKKLHLPPEVEAAPEPAMGEMIEGDDEDQFPF